MIKRFLLMGIIPLMMTGLFSMLEFFSLIEPVERRVYDLALHLRPGIGENSALLLVDVDDTAIEESKTLWPWPRDYMANGLLLMKEFGARAAVFDILYEQASPAGINLSRYQGIHEYYANVFANLKSNFSALASALAGGTLPVRQLRPVAQDYLDQMESAEASLLDRIDKLAEDRDALLGKAARAFGEAFFIVNIPGEAGDRTSGIDPRLLDKVFVKGATVEGTISSQAPDLILPIAPVLEGAKALGFPVIRVDQPDGVTRRIDLFYDYKGMAVPQLGLVALLDYLGNPPVEIKSDSVILKGALNPQTGKQSDILIPQAEDGTMLINWPKKDFIDSFNHLSFWALLDHDRVEENLIYNTSILSQLENEGRLQVVDGPAAFIETYYNPLRAMRQAMLDGVTVDIGTYRELRTAFVSKMEALFSPEKEAELVRGIAAADQEERAAIASLVKDVFKANRERWLPAYKEIRGKLKESLPGAICFTSWTSTSTTDLGVTPFSGDYANVGTHVAVVNTILEGKFLDDTPWWLTVVLTAVFTLLVYFLVFGIKRPLLSVLAGSGTLLSFGAGLLLVFVWTGVYLNVIAPFMSAFLVFIIFTVLNFLKTAKEKTFIRHAFSHYLSKEVISELIKDPSKLNLGGESKHLTALFTDIKGFSGLSEALEAPQLVRLLNGYLTDMSNIILELNGTIDKYVGDAIVSFFGAPTNLPNHASAACLAAVRMKKVERLMNEHLAAEKLSPKPLLTRIGVNTGEMVVGNMGTETYLNYTIMGHHVNLAARLEGVNKQYGTYILISESTCHEGGGSFLTRKLDRVRVMGISTPVRLYELIDEKSAVRPELFEVVEVFHQGLEAFEKREWEKARAHFKEALKMRPDDGPSEIYLKRTVQYKKNPPPANWDGVFSLTTK